MAHVRKTFGQLVLEKSPTWHFSEGPQLRNEETKETTVPIPELERCSIFERCECTISFRDGFVSRFAIGLS